jgi:hypothetical protein
VLTRTFSELIGEIEDRYDIDIERLRKKAIEADRKLEVAADILADLGIIFNTPEAKRKWIENGR